MRLQFKVNIMAGVIVSALCGLVGAQEQKTEPTVTLQAGKDGFSIKSSDQKFSLKLGSYIQGDSRFLADDESNSGVDTFQLSRARLVIDGTFYKYLSFRLMPDFGQGTTVIQDAYFDWTYYPAAKVRVGKYKAPFGLERLQSATNLLFVARGFPTSLIPNRDIGVQLAGDIYDSNLSYTVAVMNGTADGGSVDLDTNDGKDLVARIFVNQNAKATFLGGAGFGIAASYGDEERALSGYRTPSQITFFSYNTDALADGTSFRVSPQFHLFNGPVSVLGEYVISTQDVTRLGTSGEIKNSAWQISAAVNLNGEKSVPRSFEPKHPFDPGEGTWGTFQLALRYSALDIDEDAFTLGFADPTKSADSAREFTAGLNWYWNRNLKLVFNYGRTKFEGGAVSGDRETENAFLTRLQIAF